jgi:8-oxo-dGTP pyrophosphatase MutT (NUDIX family)
MKLPVPVRRVGYRVAYWLLRVYWFLLRPRVSGVKCLLTDGDLVLLVRHTYGDRRWDLPGGTMRRREQPIAAARREIAEELGIEVDEWESLGELSSYVYFRHDRLYCFQAELRDPELTLDLGELSVARWFPRDQLPDKPARFVQPVLARAGAKQC